MVILFKLNDADIPFHDVLNGHNSEGQEVVVMVRAGCKSK